MFYLVETEMTIPVPPNQISADADIDKIILSIVRDIYEDSAHPNYGYIIAVLSADVEGLGYIVPSNPSIFFKAKVKMLTFKPEYGEIIEGPISDVTQTGVYVNIGVSPKEIMVSVGALGREHFRYDTKKKELIGTKSGLIIKAGDWIRGKLYPSITPGPTARKPQKVRITVRIPIKLERVSSELKLRMSSKDQGLGLLKLIYYKRLFKTQ